ncbi:FAD-dependent oxidoreductase [Pusillimonas caeni]|uniref:FAD-binding protein n=1 Tax=Pusillimonas caeni TaxID=1348472 RepID=UPI000E59AE25|nr:FAD-binding protein [Pusillimonas caeni]TFL13205.1 FAD-dependent oxidoreductase [Pusillimonas caeni]
MPHIETDVLVIGAGAAGMYAAMAAAKSGSKVLLVDKSLVGRGGATIMAQMTVAAALGDYDEDSCERHLQDTLKAGRGLCNEALAAVLCNGAPARIRELDEWGVGWARDDAGRVRAVKAPGHSARRCVYVDVLNTGPAMAQTLRTAVSRTRGVNRVSGLSVRELIKHEGRVIGAVAVNQDDGAVVTLSAKATILAAGGLTKLFQRNSASANMGGDAYALALRAGAELVDMEFPQFFPIGHLAPRLVGMDPIMWDPFRYKLGGRLLNGNMEEFLENYGIVDRGNYTAPRDVTSYAIVKENEAGRGSPAGGAYLSFMHVPEAELRAAFGPVIDLLAENGIDLSKRPVEVAPIAHYHMGGIRVNASMESGVPGLYAAGEAVGGANGANRLSGNALPEALVFGELAGRSAARAAQDAPQLWSDEAAAPALAMIAQLAERAQAAPHGTVAGTSAVWNELKALMWLNVGLLRSEEPLTAALTRIREMRRALPQVAVTGGGVWNPTVEDWFELRGSLLVAEAITLSALNRRESRGAHQRLDYEDTETAFEKNQILRLDGAELASTWAQPVKRPAVQHMDEVA